MIDIALKLQVPITALCASQQLDISMRDIALTATLYDLVKLFYIFVYLTEKLQGSSYPTLNYAVPQYMRMIKKLKDMRSELLERSPIATATSIALKKLNDYYTLATNQYQSYSTIAMICDPRQDTDILKYWQSKQYQYPLIASIAKDYLAIPATSADSERVFSVGGDIITKKRNRLSPSTLRYLLCLRNWGILSQGDDEDSGDDADNES
ncbi:hypothetical protein V495_00589 [Pseudogymnoascus sp. VKM F-4514 (FW-929)]|nr:hypothetical protein V495_00589 [Pseudogymnoascus sp. VKM F-4514 (FW-929)]